MGDKVLSDAQKETSYFVPNDKNAETILHTIVGGAIMTAMTGLCHRGGTYETKG